ncbi:equilibrative nucleoside transporter family protein (macronuclear) [Tetrahymena thermophila SB210]|uniref:Equilibrative nucleoside transporter family protein n=1 Tax=Tetrahymena thermophila (strain SB210) TaxID=312017 RepID=Q23MK6_TETTS|nr:equilibrative nucleoside transporter family protein [Tetrahymena thermophila SB210]EAR97760.1 equilibrative nucleoside transporter family protein [Tetrahymena thermophila SB210]|eukprot:XP_001018005.1 equilibrative nucleoside transporter family protein [Tetrahymena thermophila SB210]
MEDAKLIQAAKDDLKPTLLSKTTAALLGVSSLIGWSAILNSFDYFGNKYPKETYHDVTFLFPIPLKFASFIWGLAMDYLSKRYSIKIRIGLCLGIQSLFMIAMPLVALLLQNWAGFSICMILCFLIGTTTCISQNSSIAMLSQFDKKSQGIYWIFTAWSGLSMNVGRAIVLGIFGDNDAGINNGTIVYFVMAAITIYTTIFCLFKYLKSDHHQEMMALHSAQDTAYENTTEQINYQSVSDSPSSNPNQEQLKVRLIACLKKIKFIAISIFFTYVVTFMLFPGVSIFQKQFTIIQSLAWFSVLMQLSYNIGDLSGKALSSLHFYNSTMMYILNISRGIFFFTFLMSARDPSNAFFGNDYFAFVDIFLFGLSNGLVTGGLMQLGPQRGQTPDEKNLISLILAFSLTFGISVGAFLALSLEQN